MNLTVTVITAHIHQS